jgi:hypothetical protein
MPKRKAGKKVKRMPVSFASDSELAETVKRIKEKMLLDRNILDQFVFQLKLRQNERKTVD